MHRVIALREISVTALFYLEYSRKIHLWGVRARGSKDAKRRVPHGAGDGGGGGREREREKACTHAWERERESERVHALMGERERKAFGSSFYMFFSSPWACPMQTGLSQECCPTRKSSLRSSDLPLTFLCSIFPGFSLSCLLATAILDSFSLF